MTQIYSSFEDLPASFQRYIKELVDEHAQSWVTEPSPALSGRSFLSFLNDEGTDAAALYLTKVGTKFGLPYGVTPPMMP